ncbi:hypothetical protein ACS0TY_022929 [Phlomoides rotata]
MGTYYKSLSVFLSIISLISISQSINNGGVTVDLFHRDSPLSPSHDPSKTRFELVRNAIDRSFAHKSSLLLTSLKKTSESVDATHEAPLTDGGGEYLIDYQIGTPPVRQLSIADTGSDLLWIQCQPCTSCYKQDYPPFDPTASKSYRPISCQSNQCSILDNTACGTDNNVCQYKVGYGDTSYSQGDLAAETVTLGSTAFPNFVFGCGYNNDGTFRPYGSGILGLGNGAVSIVNQQRSSLHGRFSYCLTPHDSNATSKISFGNDAVVTGPNVLSTPLVSKDPPTFYYLTLEGLSVGEQRFEYKSSSSSIKQEYEEGNIIIDSGTTLTTKSKTQIETKSKPKSKPNQNQSKPNQNQIKTQIETQLKPNRLPNQNPIETKSIAKSKPNRNQIKTQRTPQLPETKQSRRDRSRATVVWSSAAVWSVRPSRAVAPSTAVDPP